MLFALLGFRWVLFGLRLKVRVRGLGFEEHYLGFNNGFNVWDCLIYLLGIGTLDFSV